MQEFPSAGSHEVHYFNDTGYWLTLLDVEKNLSHDEDADEEEIVRFWRSLWYLEW